MLETREGMLEGSVNKFWAGGVRLPEIDAENC